jgi:hypothetical protein
MGTGVMQWSMTKLSSIFPNNFNISAYKVTHLVSKLAYMWDVSFIYVHIYDTWYSNLSSPTQFVKLRSRVTRQLGYKHTFRQNIVSTRKLLN